MQPKTILQDQLIEIVLEQITKDLRANNTDPLYSLLLSVPTNQLVVFLPQQKQQALVG